MRIKGLDKVPSAPMPRLSGVAKPVLTLLQKRTRLARRALAAQGLVEAVTWSFVSKEQALGFGGGQTELALANPIAADLSDMRPSLLPGLLKAAQRNADRGRADHRPEHVLISRFLMQLLGVVGLEDLDAIRPGDDDGIRQPEEQAVLDDAGDEAQRLGKNIRLDNAG